MRMGETRQEEDDRRAGKYERDKLMKLYGNLFYIDEFTTIADPRSTDEILAQRPKCCMPGWKPTKRQQPKYIAPETEAHFENLRRDTNKMLGRNRRLSRLRTGRERE